MKVTDKDREAARNALLKCYTRRDPFVREVGVVAAAIATARAEEREACASACGAPYEDPTDEDPWSGNDGDTFDWGVRCASYWNAAAIRARGED